MLSFYKKSKYEDMEINYRLLPEKQILSKILNKILRYFIHAMLTGFLIMVNFKGFIDF